MICYASKLDAAAEILERNVRAVVQAGFHRGRGSSASRGEILKR